MKRVIVIMTKLSALVAVLSILGGCAATSVALSKKDLDVQTKTSTAIFVEAVPKAQRKVYVEVRSGVQEFDRRAFSTFLKAQFATNDNGYILVDEPEQAHYMMSVFVLNLEKTSPTAAESALRQGYAGEAALGALAGGLAGNSNRGTAQGALAGGLLVAGGSMIANSLVKDIYYMLVVDISIKERVAKNVMVRKDSAIDSKISDAGTSRQTVSEVTDKKEYRTRIVTTANKVNLELKEAQESMFTKTAYALAGLF